MMPPFHDGNQTQGWECAPMAGGYPNNDQATAQAWIYRP